MNRIKILELACRIYVCVFLNLYGFGKIIGGQFYRKGNLPPEIAQLTLGEANHFELAWTFMGYSYAYIFFIGISQMIGGLLLLWDRTKLLGVLVLFPIMVNILLFNLIFMDNWSTMANSSIYFGMLLIILYLNRGTVSEVFKLMTTKGVALGLNGTEKLKMAGFVVALMAVVFAIDQALVNWIGF